MRAEEQGLVESRGEGRQERRGEGGGQLEASRNLVGQSESVRAAQPPTAREERASSTPPLPSSPHPPPPHPSSPYSPSPLTHEQSELSGRQQSVLPWQPEPLNSSLLSLHFSDSEVEGQRSLERVLALDGSLTSTPHPSPGRAGTHHSSPNITTGEVIGAGGERSGEGVRGEGVMEMRGRGAVRHPRPAPHRPQRGGVQARLGTRPRVRNYNIRTE